MRLAQKWIQNEKEFIYYTEMARALHRVVFSF